MRKILAKDPLYLYTATDEDGLRGYLLTQDFKVCLYETSIGSQPWPRFLRSGTWLCRAIGLWGSQPLTRVRKYIRKVDHWGTGACSTSI